jgi:hypothetical protein
MWLRGERVIGPSQYRRGLVHLPVGITFTGGIHRSMATLNGPRPDFHEWLVENFGEEGFGWIASYTEGLFPSLEIRLRSETDAILVKMAWG